MGLLDTADRAGIVASFDNVLTFQALFFKHFTVPIEERFGPEGSAAVTAALQRYGHWRGEQMAQRLRQRGQLLTAANLILGWDCGDTHLFGELGDGSISAGPGHASVTITSTPMWDYWRSQGLQSLARRYYETIYPAIAEAVGAQVELPAEGPDLVSPWTVSWSVQGAPAGAEGPARSTVLEDGDEAMETLVLGSKLNGALYYFLADQLTKRFDMAGEALLRENIRSLGRERAAAQLERHAGMGLPRDLVTLQNHWDGNLVSVWVFDPGYLSPGTWHQDCSWCPYYVTWESFGKRGLALGYIYDYELHPTLYRAYHPDCIVQFEAIKTRGDSHCRFRVSIPSLQKPGEPSFPGYTGGDV
jgi:hypothetical protein